MVGVGMGVRRAEAVAWRKGWGKGGRVLVGFGGWDSTPAGGGEGERR